MSDTAAAPEAKKGKGKIIIIAVVALALVAGGWFFFLKPDGKEKAPEPGAVLVVEPITVNLSGGNYLKIGVALQMSAEAGGHGDPNSAPALDLIIDEYSQASLADVTGKRDEMKKHLEKEIIHAYHGDVLSIWLTEYVAQ